MRTTVIYILGALAVSYATGTLSDKVEKTTDLDTKSVLPRVLITFALGGIIFLAGQEYRRAFEPQTVKDFKNQFSS